MSLLTKIKAGLALVFFLIIGGLSAMLKIRTNQKEEAEAERDIAESKASSTQKRVEAHEKRQDIEDDIAIGDLPNTDGMHDDPYNRDPRS